jgi:hypothetical protein
MKRIAVWIWDHWWLAALAIGLVFAVIWSRRVSPSDLAARLKLELDSIGAKAEARRAQELLGAERAREQVEATYRNEIIALDEVQRKRALELQGDPVALAQFLVRAGGSSKMGDRKAPF